MPITAAHLAELEAAAAEASAAGEAATDPAEKLRLFRRAVYLHELRDLLRADVKGPLTRGKNLPKLGDMNDAHREAISKGRTKRSPMMRAARAKGYRTLGALAEAVGVSASLLSQVAAGTKKSEPVAEKLRALIGWPP